MPEHQDNRLPVAEVIDDIDRIADEFEAAWVGGQTPRIEDFLEDAGEDFAADFLRELLTTELELRIRQGDVPLPQDYLSRFRPHGDIIRETFALLDVAAEPPRLDPPASSRGGASVSIEPRRVGPYQLLEKIGQGGMGEVFRAMHLKLQRIVAVKILPGALMLTPEAVARFNREIIVAGKLDHPNLVRTTDANEHHGVPYLAMEYIDGVDLDELSAVRDPLPIADACAIICQAAEGLQHLHMQGLVHRDIKPSNLMLTKDGQVKILDMGLAMLSDLSEQDGLTSTFRLLGTIDYMAPEQAEDTHNVDIRADVYGLGATLFKLLCGRTPLGESGGDNRVLKIVALTTRDTPPIGRFRSDVPRQLQKVLDRMLAKDRERRFSPAAVVAALRPFARDADLPGLMRASLAMQQDDQERPSLAADSAPSPDPGRKTAVSPSNWLTLAATIFNVVIVTGLSLAFLLDRFDGAATAPPAMVIAAAGTRPGTQPGTQPGNRPGTAVGREQWAAIAPAAAPAARRGTFGFVATGQMLGNLNSTAVALGDLDGDGDVDALVANGADEPNQIWRNNGRGHFVLDDRADVGVGDAPTALADLNTDGALDVVGGETSGLMRVFLGDGSAGFQPSGAKILCPPRCRIAVGDLDNDGDADLVVSFVPLGRGTSNRIWLNDGRGSFSDSHMWIGESVVSDIALGDLDRDGDLDAFVAASDGKPDRVWFNDGAAMFHDSGQCLGAYRTNAVALGDLDGDGDLDAMTVHGNQPNHVWINDGCGVFSDSGQSLGNFDSTDVALGDLDLDGDLDAIVANSYRQPNCIWLNDGRGRYFDSGLQLGQDCSTGVALADLDGDGDLDAFTANANHEPNRVWMNLVIADYPVARRTQGSLPLGSLPLGSLPLGSQPLEGVPLRDPATSENSAARAGQVLPP